MLSKHTWDDTFEVVSTLFKYAYMYTFEAYFVTICGGIRLTYFLSILEGILFKVLF